MRKQLFRQKYIKCEVSHRELWECQFTLMSCSFSLSKTVNLMVFYCRITLNMSPMRLFTVQKLSVNQLTVLHCSIFTVFYRFLQSVDNQ